MARKPGRMYTRTTGPAYTRREYMRGIEYTRGRGGPSGICRIAQFDMGEKTKQFPVSLHLHMSEACQVRHTALESARVSTNRFIQKTTGPLGYHLKIRVYPFHILRENKQATGAGADRVSQGMRQAFGKPVGTAARVFAHQKVITLSVPERHADTAKRALWKAGLKLPSPAYVTITKNE